MRTVASSRPLRAGALPMTVREPLYSPLMSDDPIRASMTEMADDELMAIATGATLGYTEFAQRIAEDVLRKRRVELPRNLEKSRRDAAEVAEQQRKQLGEAEA